MLNRVYDSSGPDGRVRGTPAQVIEKYQSLARDSALSGDRVAMENFQQHAEHYIRLINEAQRQIADRRENENRSAPQPQAQAQPAAVQDPGSGDQPDVVVPVKAPAKAPVKAPAKAEDSVPNAAQLEALPGEAAQDAAQMLVETPEAQAAATKRAPAARTRKPRTRKTAKPAEKTADVAAPVEDVPTAQPPAEPVAATQDQG